MSALSLVMKVLILSTIGVYIVFAFIVIRQVAMMRNTLKTPLGSIWNSLAVLHFILVLVLFVVALVIL
ncbi:MAG: hypothetical protein Q8R11_02820 [bacterium]|nr:hypothetical protein [bacterium]